MVGPPLARERLTGLTRAARDLGLSRHTLRRAIDQGELPTYVIGRRARVKVSDLRAWLESHRQRRR